MNVAVEAAEIKPEGRSLGAQALARAMSAPQTLKDAATALSLANLFFISTWTQLISDSTALHVRFVTYTFNAYVGVMVNVLLFAFTLWSATTLARRSGKLMFKVAQLTFPLALLVPINGFLRALWPRSRPVTELVLIVIAIALICLSDTARYGRLIRRAAGVAITVMLPFTPIMFLQSSWVLTKFSDKPPAPINPGAPSAPRVVWLILDEMDQEIAFSKRPETIALPEFDRLRGESFYATNAYPPADFTLMSIPALLSGRLVSRAEPVNPSELIITFADSDKPVSFATQPNLFSEARELQLNTGMIGYYFPHCRIIGQDLTSCFWTDFLSLSLGRTMLRQVDDAIATVPLVSILATHYGIIRDSKAKQNEERRGQLHTFKALHERAKAACVSSDLGVLLVHLPIPHPAGIYDRRRGDYDVDAASSYLDNLKLADRTLGEIRAAMEAAGAWDSAILLVSSDHAWRPYLWRSVGVWTAEDEEASAGNTDDRVPFLLKLVGQKAGIEYDTQFNTVLTHDLLLALLKGEIGSPQGVADWIDEHRSIGPSPFRLGNSN